MERLSHEEKSVYNEIESSMHINKYLILKENCLNKTILDVSCGNGYGSYLISTWGAKSVVGLDISTESIAVANRIFSRDNIQFKSQNIEDLSMFEDDTFDLLVSFETMEHLNNPTSFLNEIKRVTKKNGTIIISCPNDYYDYPTEEMQNPFHKHKYTHKEFKNMTSSILGNADFQFIGLPISGFTNIVVSKTEEENKNIPREYGLELKLTKEAFQVPMDAPIDIGRVSYFVSIWSKDISPKETMVFYPSLLHKKDIEGEQMYEKFRLAIEDIKQNKKQEDEYITKINQLTSEIYKQQFQKKSKEKNMLESIDNREKKIEELSLYKENSQELEKKVKELEKKVKELEKKVEELEVYDEVTGMLAYKRLRQIYDSKSYKILQKIQSILDKLRR